MTPSEVTKIREIHRPRLRERGKDKGEKMVNLSNKKREREDGEASLHQEVVFHIESSNESTEEHLKEERRLKVSGEFDESGQR